jgi:CBS domain-containing protein
MSLKSVSICPPPTCRLGNTVSDAVSKMMEMPRNGAVLVMDDGHLVGIFSERDILTKIVYSNRDPSEVKVGEVMTRDPQSMSEDHHIEDALKLMLKNGFRHLPIIDEDGNPSGLVSIRQIFKAQVDHLAQLTDSLISYMGADGPGG